MKVLLVDDDDLIRTAMKYFFKNKTLIFQTAESAEQGLEYLDMEQWNIIISDYQLPGMNGVEFLGIVNRKFPNVIKVIITAFGDRDMVAEAEKIGVDDFVLKPFSARSITESLTRLLYIQQTEL
jgi:YesN/AraC family two-component response regulator